MYVVIDKKTKDVIHVNPAPLSQKLSPKEVYFKFDDKHMQMGCFDGDLPEHFDIDAKGNILPLNLEEKIKRGLVKVRDADKPVEASASVYDEAGSLVLSAHQKVVGDQVVEKSQQEQVDEGLVSLEEIKSRKIEEFSQQSLAKRNTLIPDYKIHNALMGIGDENKLERYKATVEAFRQEFYRLKDEVEKAKDVKSIEKIEAKFPSEVQGEGKTSTGQKKTAHKKRS